jgi:3-phenylpropionate/trans-cinnamate dioxygenase ferredoxin reductase subunit
MNNNGMVIVGAGEAGARAAVEIRKAGWSGPITLIGNERRYPYERPPLSKYQLYAEEDPVPVAIGGQSDLEQYGISFINDDEVVRIDRPGHQIELASQAIISYERLLLATGAKPRPLTVQGSGAGDMLYLRRFDDAVKIRGKLQRGKRAAIIGGGFIGLEVAASASIKGCQATVIEVAPRILMRGVPEVIASLVEQRHREAGVAFRIGVMLQGIDREEDEYVIRLADGNEIRCDVIIVGIGAIPETSLASHSGLATENGIKVNEFLQTSDPDIYAVGDCCSFPHLLYSGRRIRLEAWRNAQDQGLHVAGNMLGASVPYTAVPWFWSDQYEQTLQVAGLLDQAALTVPRDLGTTGKLFFHLEEDGRLIAVSGIGPEGGIAKDMRLAEMLIEKQARPRPEELADANIRLKELLRA